MEASTHPHDELPKTSTPTRSGNAPSIREHFLSVVDDTTILENSSYAKTSTASSPKLKLSDDNTRSNNTLNNKMALEAPNVAKNFHPSAIVCKEATIEGDVTIGAGTVVHPFAIVRATKGPIIIGENNNIEERCLIENISEGQIMLIGDENNIEADSVLHASSVGNKNIIQGKSEVGPGVIITDGCTVGVKCQLLQKGSIPAKTVIWGKDNRQRIAHDNPDSILPILEIYRKMLPSYHHLYKATSKDVRPIAAPPAKSIQGPTAQEVKESEESAKESKSTDEPPATELKTAAEPANSDA